MARPRSEQVPKCPDRITTRPSPGPIRTSLRPLTIPSETTNNFPFFISDFSLPSSAIDHCPLSTEHRLLSLPLPLPASVFSLLISHFSHLTSHFLAPTTDHRSLPDGEFRSNRRGLKYQLKRLTRLKRKTQISMLEEVWPVATRREYIVRSSRGFYPRPKFGMPLTRRKNY
jgi:hypothetical protein